MEKSHRIIFETTRHGKKALEAVRKDLEKQKLSQLVNGDLIVIGDLKPYYFQSVI